jgi:hypothetical protein
VKAAAKAKSKEQPIYGIAQIMYNLSGIALNLNDFGENLIIDIPTSLLGYFPVG